MFRDLLKASILLGVVATTGIAQADLISVGDVERFSLDANVNLSWFHAHSAPGNTPLEIPMTAGNYSLTFTDEVADRTAWNAWPSAGWDYWVGGLWIMSPDAPTSFASALFHINVVGAGSSQAEAFADASPLTFGFSVPTDQTGLAILGDYDTNNEGGLTFDIAKVPAPSAIVLGILGLGVAGVKLRKRA